MTAFTVIGIFVSWIVIGLILFTIRCAVACACPNLKVPTDPEGDIITGWVFFWPLMLIISFVFITIGLCLWINERVHYLVANWKN